MSSQPGTREVAYRMFAAEFEDADFEFSESDEERAPNYVVTPSGARVNRLFLVGVLTELDRVNDEMLRARIVDPTGAFVVYAGQYQPDELAFLESVDPPTFLAVTGKARTFQPDDSDRVYTSVRPESISDVDGDTRDRWIVDTARRTLERVGIVAAAIETGLTGEDLRDALETEGVDQSLAQGVALALDHYGTSPAYLSALRELALDAVRVVAGEREEVDPLTLDPGAGDGDAAALADLSVDREPTPTVDATDSGADAPGALDDSTEESPSTAPTAGPDSKPTEAAQAEGGETVNTAEVEAAAAEADDLGDFDEDFDPDDDILDEEARQEIEEEYGTEFATGSEVESEPEVESEAGDAEAEPLSEEASDAASEGTPESADGVDSEPEPTDTEPAEAIDPEETVLEIMADLDDGDGADRDAVVERAVEEFGLEAGTADDAIEDAMMSGQAYEPDEGKIKPI